TFRGVCIWQAATLTEWKVFRFGGLHVTGIAFTPDRRSLAVGLAELDAGKNQFVKGRVKLCDLVTGEETTVLQAQPYHVWVLAFTADGTRLAANGDGPTIRVVDLTQNP